MVSVSGLAKLAFTHLPTLIRKCLGMLENFGATTAVENFLVCLAPVSETERRRIRMYERIPRI